MCPVTVSPVSSYSKLYKVTRLRYQVLVKELQRHHPHEYIRSSMLLEPVDDVSTNLAFEIGNKVIGGLRLTPLREQIRYEPDFSHKYDVQNDALMKDTSIYASRLFLLKEYRQHKWFAFFMSKVYHYLKDQQTHLIYLNTCRSLVKMYRKLGFNLAGCPFYLSEVGDLVFPMVVVLDEDHLSRVNSMLSCAMSILLNV